MTIVESDRVLFSRVWALGAKAVKDNRITALTDVALDTPTLEQYQDSHGQRMTDMIKVVQIGISLLRERGQFVECDQNNMPPSPRRIATMR
jgi:hypothetical protein